MERNPRGGSLGVELDVQGCGVGGEGDDWGSEVVLADIIVVGRVLGPDGELSTSTQALSSGDLGGIPRGIAVGITIVAALARILGAVQIAVEVKLLTRVVLVDVGAITVHVVNTVFYGPDTASSGILSNTNRVTQAPAQQGTIANKVIGSAVAGSQVKGLDLRVARVDV